MKQLLRDESLRTEVERQLKASGLILLEQPYSESVAVAIHPNNESAIFSEDDGWISSNQGLSRPTVALLVILWSLLVMPKRQRQIETARSKTYDATEISRDDAKLLPVQREPEGVPVSRLKADFKVQLGGIGNIDRALAALGRLDFVRVRNKVVYEGPLLDLCLDYSVMAPRILDGTLTGLMQKRDFFAPKAAVEDESQPPSRHEGRASLPEVTGAQVPFEWGATSRSQAKQEQVDHV
jgi:hypothetical protein